MITVEFVVTSFLVVVAPGTGVIYTISMGLAHQRRGAIAAAIGCTIGILPHLIASAVGVSAILHGSTILFQTVRYLGVVYLLYVAYTMWRAPGGSTSMPGDYQPSGFQIVLKGVLINLLNPRLTLFFLAFLPQFTGGQTSVDLQALAFLAAIFAGMTLIVFLAYGLLAEKTNQVLLNRNGARIWAQRSLSALIAGLALHLAVGDR